MRSWLRYPFASEDAHSSVQMKPKGASIITDWELLPFDRANLEEYLSSLYQAEIEVTAVKEFEAQAGETQLKEFGYGTPLFIQFTHNGQAEQVVFNTMNADGYGHERPSDRARNLLLDHATFNQLPRHVRSLDVGAFTPDNELVSIGRTGEFFLLTEYVRGRLYAADLQRIADEERLSPSDEARTLALAGYLARIHAQKQPDELRYRRRIRDLVGHGEGIMGILDGYPPDFALAPPERLLAIEQQCVEWRWRVKGRHERLSQVHGDFHPWNVLFRAEADFTVLDRSRGAWGEPADDVSSMSINYILFSLRQHGRFSGPFRQLYRLFWERYLEQTNDVEALVVIQPFYAWRALVLAHPVWYPTLPGSVRESLLRFAENLLASDQFDPRWVEDYLD